MTQAPVLRLALDQNFPTPIIQALARWMPTNLVLRHVHQIHPSLSYLNDRDLITAVGLLGFDGLATNNYRMLNEPAEIASVVSAKIMLVAVIAAGHNPIRASGSLLVELPGLPSRARRGVGTVVRLHFEPRPIDSAWHHLRSAVVKAGGDIDDAWPDLKALFDLERGA